MCTKGKMGYRRQDRYRRLDEHQRQVTLADKPSIMDDDCRLGRHRNLRTFNSVEARLVDYTITAHHSVLAIGNGNRAWLLVGIERHNNVSPCVSTGIASQAKGDKTIVGWQELKMLTHEVGIA